MNLDTANVHEQGEGSASTAEPNVTPAALAQVAAAVEAEVDKPQRKRKARAKRKPTLKVVAPARVMVEGDLYNCDVIELPPAAIINEAPRVRPVPRAGWLHRLLSI